MFLVPVEKLSAVASFAYIAMHNFAALACLDSFKILIVVGNSFLVNLKNASISEFSKCPPLGQTCHVSA